MFTHLASGPYQVAIESSGVMVTNVELPSSLALEAGETVEIDVIASTP